MSRRTVLLATSAILVAICAVVSIVLFLRRPTETKAITAVEKVGGKITRDETKAGNPVIAVDLAGCLGVTDEVLRELASCKHLQELDLTGCKEFTDVGLKELAACKQLRNLSLYGCSQKNLTEVGLKELGACKQLQKLDLTICRVSDAVLKELAACKQLQSLNLYGAVKITDVGLKELVGRQV